MALSRRGLIGLMALAISVGGAPALAQAPAQASPAAPVDVMAPAAGDRSIGRDDAPVTVVEYASFTCSHCSAWWSLIYPDFKARFIDTGRARLVVRDLPTAPVSASAPAAMLARCAAPDRFHDVAGALLADRSFGTDEETFAWLGRAAVAGGMSLADFRACFGDPAGLSALDARIAAAHAAGVTGTPAFFIDGDRFTAIDNIDAFDAAITAATPEPGAP